MTNLGSTPTRSIRRRPRLMRASSRAAGFRWILADLISPAFRVEAVRRDRTTQAGQLQGYLLRDIFRPATAAPTTWTAAGHGSRVPGYDRLLVGDSRRKCSNPNSSAGG